MEPNTLQVELARRINAWGRNTGTPDRVRLIISETEDVVEWLTDPRTNLLHDDTFVLVRQARRGRTLPRSPGRWLRYTGALDEPGDEIQLGDDFFLQMSDYPALRYLSVAGPTMVRMYGAADVDAYLADVRQARATGRVPDVLIHPAVELGDRCALSGGPPCTLNGLGGRLYIADRSVRTAPGGRIIGEVGDSRRVLTGSAYSLAAHGDVCLAYDTVTALHGADPNELSGYLAALDAMRTMTLRTKVAWKVSGLGYRIAGHALADETGPPRADLLLLTSGTDQVLFDARVVRGFKIGQGMAEILDVLLHTTRPDTVYERLRRCPSIPGDPMQAALDVRAELTRRGVDLPELAGAGAGGYR